MIDKFKTCKDCPDRSISPNCHNTCEGYLERCRKNEERKKREREHSAYVQTFYKPKVYKNHKRKEIGGYYD